MYDPNAKIEDSSFLDYMNIEMCTTVSHFDYKITWNDLINAVSHFYCFYCMNKHDWRYGALVIHKN